MTTLRTALRSALEAGDVGPLASAGFADLELDDLRTAVVALADQSPAALGQALDAAASEADITSVLGGARAALAHHVAPVPLDVDLIAGADPSDELDFAPWGAPATPPDHVPVDELATSDDIIEDFDDDLDFGSGDDTSADHDRLFDELSGLDELDGLDVHDDPIDDLQATGPDEADIPADDPFAIGAVDLEDDLDDLDDLDDEDGDGIF